MNKKSIVFLITLIVLFAAVFVARFVLNGGEDTWICEKVPASAGGGGEQRWVKHGNPSGPAPETGCGISEPSIPAPTERIAVTVSETDTDEDIIAGVTKAFADKYRRPEDSFILSVGEKDADHAKGSVRFKDELDGGLWFAAKTDAGWELAFDGQGIMSCENADKYGFSTAMVPGCIDIENGNAFVNRE